jgi:hypothetical protein
MGGRKGDWMAGARSDGIGTGSRFVSTRFLCANRYPLTDQVRGHASLENALMRRQARTRFRLDFSGHHTLGSRPEPDQHILAGPQLGHAETA